MPTSRVSPSILIGYLIPSGCGLGGFSPSPEGDRSVGLTGLLDSLRVLENPLQ